MASATTNDGGKTMGSELISPGADEPRQPRPARNETGGGFFHVYKHGQGYWTRMSTAGAATVIIAMTAYFIWQQLPAWISYLADSTHKSILLGIVAAFVAGSALLVWRLMNKPTNADFLIATDSEMKKVNWTSRKELIGSTKVVIIFMFFIAGMLFELDLMFGDLFYYAGLLAVSPLPHEGDFAWTRWAFWAFMLLQISGILLLVFKARAGNRR